MNWYLAAFQKYAVVEGRSRRKEYWMFVLFNFLAMFGLVIAGTVLFGEDSALGSGLLGLYTLATIVPSMAVGIRRLHDVDRSGWWTLISFVPLLGAIILLFWACQEGTRGDNRFGADPKLFEL